MKLYLNLLILFILPLIAFTLKAQSTLPSINFVPQSPTASAFGRYGEIPVDHSTGVPKIEIPIYTIQLEDVTIPITISYHASGIKVRDIASEVGLGWVLNIGGVVVANIVGKPDLSPSYREPFNYRQTSDIQNAIANASSKMDKYNLAYHFWDDLVHSPAVDFYSDRFFYSLCTGESGIFRRDFVTKEPKTMPFHPIKINLKNFEVNIISANGTKSYFAAANDFDCYFLQKVVPANTRDSAMYYYSYGNDAKIGVYSFSVTWQDNVLNFDGNQCGSYTYDPVSGCQIHRQWNDLANLSVIKIDSIRTKKEVICFEYIKDRDDVQCMLAKGYRLSKIVIKDREKRRNQKVVKLVHDYFGTQVSNNKRLKLKELSITGSTSKTDAPEHYYFNYNALELPPYPDLDNQILYSEDYWGYYNGSSNYYLFPPFFSAMNIPGLQLGELANNLEPDSLYSKACMLNEIIYPTGGKSIFEYEANCILGRVGGVRVKKITSYESANSKAFTKTYEYGYANYRRIEAYDYTYSTPIVDIFYYRKASCMKVISASEEKHIAFSNSLHPITNNNGTNVMYSTVKEYFGDEVSNNGGNIYSYDILHNDLPLPYSGDDSRFMVNYQDDYGNFEPLLKSKITWGNGVIQKEIVNEYTEYKQSEFNTGLFLQPSANLIGGGVISQDAAFDLYTSDFNGNLDGNYLNNIVYFDTKAYQNTPLLTRTIEYENGVSIVTDYKYDNLTQLSKKSVKTSANNFFTTTYKYPYDVSGDVYSNMVINNMLSPKIEQIDSIGTTPIQSTKTNYYNWGNNVIAPQTVETKKGTNDYETRVNYTYDNITGNIVTASKTSGTPESYIWGYNQTLPVVKIVGKSYSDIPQSVKDAITGHTFSGSTTYSSIVADMAYIKTQLATLLSDATCMVTFYTYAPLVGMTSQTDSNKVTTYYEYDTFGRLKCIRNDDGDILKSYEYHYKQ